MMRRPLPLLFLAVLLTTLISAVTLAQDDHGDGSIVVNGRLLDPASIPGAMIDGAADPLPAKFSTNAPWGLAAFEPADSCDDAPDIALSPEFPADGISFNVEFSTEETDDPTLSCMWGNPSRAQGYRTVWYRLVAPASGRITLDSFSSGYDTVIGVFSGECGDLQPVQCNDDTNGFASETTIPVSAGESYYIVVADWQPGIPREPLLNFSALLQPVNPLWELVSTKPGSPAISRHSTVSQFDLLYVIGGQTGGEGVPLVSNQLSRLNTYTEEWQTLAQIPGAGYSNTTAALVNDRIYLPSGYNGNNLGYDGLHWAYTINPDRSQPGSWATVKPVPKGPNGKNFAWAASAVPPSNDRYYLMGGTASTSLFDNATESNDEAYVYLTNSNTWLPVDPMQTPRYAHTGTWLSANNLGACAAGGLGVLPGGEFVFHTSAECYQPGRGWRFIGDMNIPRIGAGSVTGPDGKWYVFGGLTALNETTLAAVLQTEVYDPYRNTWSLLPPEYNLGGQDLLAARAFPSGSVVGNELYVTGGSIGILSGTGENALPLTEKMLLPSDSSFMPILFGNYDDYLRPDDNFEQARSLWFGQAQERNFSGQRDFYDFYTFELQSTTQVEINLDVPADNDFDLYLYGQNKLLWGSSAAPLNGADESISILLEPRRYYVVVKRSFPTAQPDKGAAYRVVLLN